MVERVNEPDPGWIAVDRYIADRLLADDPKAALTANARAGLPDIDVSPPQGKMLHLFARMCGAQRILEVGRSAAIPRSGWHVRCPPAAGW